MANKTAEDHEIAYINAFVAKDRRDRYLTLSSSAKHRHKFLKLLAHNHIDDLIPDFVHQILPIDQTDVKILELLAKQSSQKDCYGISESSKIDKKALLIADAFSEIFGLGVGTILSIEPGKLAYYESEDQNGRYLISAERTR